MVASTSKYKYIVCDPELCIGCQLCEYICSYTKTGEFNSYRSRIRTVRVDEVLITAVACRTCENAPCVIACPRDALSQDSETGIIRIDNTKCDGCAWCIEACDYGAMMLHPETKIVYSCDLCKFRPDGPQCVKWCPEEALTVVTSDVLAQKARISAIKKLFQTPGEKE